LLNNSLQLKITLSNSGSGVRKTSHLFYAWDKKREDFALILELVVNDEMFDWPQTSGYIRNQDYVCRFGEEKNAKDIVVKSITREYVYNNGRKSLKSEKKEDFTYIWDSDQFLYKKK